MTTAPLSPTGSELPAQRPADARVGRLDYWLALPLLLLIRVYQRTLSRLLPPACRFEPSCSRYAAAALQHHHLPRALALTAWRLARCQPFCAGGCDPVPPGVWQGRWRVVMPSAQPRPPAASARVEDAQGSN